MTVGLEEVDRLGDKVGVLLTVSEVLRVCVTLEDWHSVTVALLLAMLYVAISENIVPEGVAERHSVGDPECETVVQALEDGQALTVSEVLRVCVTLEDWHSVTVAVPLKD